MKIRFNIYGIVEILFSILAVTCSIRSISYNFMQTEKGISSIVFGTILLLIIIKEVTYFIRDGLDKLLEL
jgi:hypothetical protein